MLMANQHNDSDDTGLQLIATLELEKKMMAYDLHDGLAQLLVGAKMNLDSLQTANLDSKELSRLSAAQSAIDEAMSEARNCINRLRATTLEQAEFVPEIEMGLHRTAFIHQASISLAVIGSPASTNSLANGMMYRIIQEAVSNSLKHGQTAEVYVVIIEKQGRSQIWIIDNGIGFTKPFRTIKSGIRGMGDRCRFVGGQCRIVSQVDGASHSILSIPPLSETTTELDRPKMIDELSSSNPVFKDAQTGEEQVGVSLDRMRESNGTVVCIEIPYHLPIELTNQEFSNQGFSD